MSSFEASRGVLPIRSQLCPFALKFSEQLKRPTWESEISNQSAPEVPIVIDEIACFDTVGVKIRQA